ncbi:hypothetical protein EKK58_01345 [Candidatus Dependentiae bacterium]|nr:MAG: hypothetical protein EKK58_01345 [Candidatus Dependentiae bacterium]
MKIPGLGTTYPTTGYTSNGVLFSSLGSFWTRVFGDKEAIRGLTIAQSEELIQRYYDFVESLNAMSIKKIDLLHRERWLPVRIRKSQVRLAPLRFLPTEDKDHAVFGPQPLPASAEERNNSLHYGETFQFGRAKRPVEQKYVVRVDPALKSFPVIADRIVAPTKVLTVGVDFWLNDGELYFASNPFDSDEYFKYELFDNAGNQLTFTWKPELATYATQEFETDTGPVEGTVFNEEEMILWVYHGGVNTDSLYENFGTLFGLSEPNSEGYKQILSETINLLTEGPTVKAITGLAASFLGVQLTQDPEETLVDAYSVDDMRYVVTDKRVYTASTFFAFSPDVYHTDANPLLAGVRVGAKLPAGTPLFDAVTYYDNVSQPNWWKTELDRLVLPGSMFMGDYEGVLIFENIAAFTDRDDENRLRYTPDIINTEPGRILFPFPPTVTQEDQDRFNDYISDESRYYTVRTLIEDSLNLAGLLDPLDFVFKNFLKTNSAMLRIRFQTFEQAAKFAHFFRLVKTCLPQYLYIIFDFDLPIPQETVSFTVNTDDVATLSSDGSDPDGWVKVPPYDKPPWQLQFGWPATTLEVKRPFVISHLLDLVHTYTNGYGTFYQYANGLTGTNDIPLDKIDFSLSYKPGDDAANIPIAYQKTGTVVVVQDGLVVNGSGTKFTTELSVGDLLYSRDDSNEYREITEITSDTVLKIKTAFSGSTRTINLWVAHDTPSTRNVSGLIFWRL